ncbi:MAG: UDP-N-acetylglucosamine 1-carboxyvinyltransferase [Planctomycetes bacterium]|nr:UDP-N-acetylglucosamine 1-carboxyvinyltransferase [Planctomycetota bacterium]
MGEKVDKLVIRGGTPLSGKVRVSGSKNGALPILFATLLAEDPVVLRNVPRLVDIRTTQRMLQELDVQITDEKDALKFVTPAEGTYTASYQLVRRMRASVSALGPLLARRGRARVSLPGGCAIGQRPIDLHLKGIRALGAEIQIRHGYVEATARQLRGTTIYLSGPFGSTVLGTANVMLAATRAKGVTVIDGAACEPEIVALAQFLRVLGVPIEGEGTHCLRIQGVDRVGGGEFTIPPDRIEAGTYVIAGAMAGGNVAVEACAPGHLRALIDVLQRAEVPLEIGEDFIHVHGTPAIRPVELATLPYPGFPTDLQAQLMALLCRANGVSLITEKVYPDRFMHVAELNRLGAQIRKEGSTAIILGGHRLSGADVMASDLRASACLVLAALIADGETEIHRIYHLDRGYVRMEEKLAGLGADIRREDDEEGV